MFNPAMFNRQDIERLRDLCEQPAAATTGRQLRSGTADEWRIIGGMAEGTIIRQHTQAIQEDIRVAAEVMHTNTPDLRKMLSLAKTISYNHVHRSLHFFFFDRATARQYRNVQVPFNRNVYRLANVHRPDTGSVWLRQLAHDGTRKSPQRQYEVDIYIITRFTDIGRIEAYLQQNITAKFELDDLDTCRPESRTSVVWRLTVHTAECPEFLRSIVRIIWIRESSSKRQGSRTA
ncbi:uncharacterized protein PITG_21776 [Phytophthora infestans T30-4]|uniref:Uncharacterized protein n=1 Tax=Phytophthora infestans (strain T30-4) TaxID=403677 RepID=D0P4E7_PHYIT|nr:uncharacterized protein PITG_21776 [Phytophthora infestans T30-4]EEY65301.1 conserved hypothetical protein [Phytophthora infestans T30-4]|eukprot:XP_002894827.1 conserved hypothetical protein [Phytophthora infestans T30-4]